MRVLLVGLILLLSACMTPPQAPEDADAVADGRAVAEAQCASCHAIGPYGDSPAPEAPVFRTILSRYDANALEQNLIEGIQVSHPMPEFQFNPQGADALIAYLVSIQTDDPGESEGVEQSPEGAN
ncbi:MAG: cytochrome c [Hyphomonadaceae bacterium]|nr:cytochrome c [Hyphomonadaceae bacterium]